MGPAAQVRLFILYALCCTAVQARELPVAPPLAAHTNGEADGSIRITRLSPDRRGGKAYRLVYRVAVPITIMWHFKTDFDNDFLLHNKYIQAHRLVSRRHNIVVTEDHYSQFPDARFTWQTTLSPDRRRLNFKLLNAQQAGQKFHYGYIQLQAEGQVTRITQVGYFDFLGASLWAGYPWDGGMNDFLTYSAHWEQHMARQRMPLYRGKPGP